MSVEKEIAADVQAEDVRSDVLAFILEHDRALGVEVARMFGGEEHFIPTYDYISLKSKHRYIVTKTKALTPTNKIAKDLRMGVRAVRKIKKNLIKKPFRESLVELHNSPSDQE